MKHFPAHLSYCFFYVIKETILAFCFLYIPWTYTFFCTFQVSDFQENKQSVKFNNTLHADYKEEIEKINGQLHDY